MACLHSVHNYIYNIDINPFKGIHIAYSEGRVGGDQILLLRTALEWHQNRLRPDLEIRRPIHNRVRSNRHGPQLTSSASTRWVTALVPYQVTAINCQARYWRKLCHRTGKDIFSYPEIIPALPPSQQAHGFSEQIYGDFFPNKTRVWSLELKKGLRSVKKAFSFKRQIITSTSFSYSLVCSLFNPV